MAAPCSGRGERGQLCLVLAVLVCFCRRLSVIVHCPPTVGKGAISVRPSVCLSVAYIANYSRTHRLACPNLERRFPTFDATGTPVSKSNGQRSGLEAGSGTVFGGNRRPHRLFDEGLEVYFYCILTVVVIEESGAFLRSGFLLGLLGHLKMFLLAFAPIIRVFNSRHPVRTQIIHLVYDAVRV